MLIRNIWCWTLDSKVEVSTSIYGGIGTPLVTQQPTWWYKVHLSRKAHVLRAMLISELECWWTKFNVEVSLIKLKSKLECWWTKFNVELSLIKLKSKIFTIALRTTNWTTKLNVDLCQVKCYTLKLNVMIYFDFWLGWNSILTVHFSAALNVAGTNVITGHKCNKGHKCNNIWSQL